jgi:hypothetical protein
MMKFMSQLQNSSPSKTALLRPLASAATRLLSQVYSRRGSPDRQVDPDKKASKSSIFKRRGFLQLALMRTRYFFRPLLWILILLICWGWVKAPRVINLHPKKSGITTLRFIDASRNNRPLVTEV